MDRQNTSGVVLPLWLALFLLGYGCAQDNQKGEPPPEAHPLPVLKPGDDAKTIIRKAVKAHGGKKAFTCWSCGYLKYKTSGNFIPAQLGEVILEDTFQLPGHFKRVTHMEVNGKERLLVFVINHGKCWTKKGDAPAEPSDNNYTKRTEHTFAAFCNLAPLTEAGARLTKLGAKKVNGEKAIGLRAESKKLGEVDFYVSMQTGLVLKSRKLVPGTDQNKPSIMESFLENYKNVKGIQVPMRIKGAQDGKPIVDVTLIEARFANTFEDNTFAKP
jgi:hypothetical protein